MGNIREFYMKRYPTDELGKDINPDVTFDQLVFVLDQDVDVYDFLGVHDSIVRERCFARLAELLDEPYEAVYDRWIF